MFFSEAYLLQTFVLMQIMVEMIRRQNYNIHIFLSSNHGVWFGARVMAKGSPHFTFWWNVSVQLRAIICLYFAKFKSNLFPLYWLTFFKFWKYFEFYSFPRLVTVLWGRRLANTKGITGMILSYIRRISLPERLSMMIHMLAKRERRFIFTHALLALSLQFYIPGDCFHCNDKNIFSMLLIRKLDLPGPREPFNRP